MMRPEMKVGRADAKVSCIALALVCVAFASLVVAAQEHPSARLIYARDVNARQCPDEPELRDLVSARLGYVPFRDDAQLVVTTRIEATPRGLRATVEARNAQGEITGSREIVSRTRDCQELARGVALAISIAIDPFVLTGGAPPLVDAGVEHDANAEDATIAEDVTIAEDASASAAPDASGHGDDAGVADAGVADVRARTDAAMAPESETEHAQLALGGTLGLVTSSLPAPRPYLALDAELAYAFLLARVSLAFTFPASDSRAMGGTVTASRFTARLDPCAGYRVAFVCAGVALRTHFARGSDIDVARRASETTFAFAGQARLRYPITDGLVLGAGIGLEAPFRRISLELDGAGVWREPKVAPFFELSALWRIP